MPPNSTWRHHPASQGLIALLISTLGYFLPTCGVVFQNRHKQRQIRRPVAGYYCWNYRRSYFNVCRLGRCAVGRPAGAQVARKRDWNGRRRRQKTQFLCKRMCHIFTDVEIAGNLGQVDEREAQRTRVPGAAILRHTRDPFTR